MPKLNRNGGNIYDEGHGSGASLILTHGCWSTSATWPAQIAAPSEYHKLVLWDFRSHGRSIPRPASMPRHKM